VTATYRTLIIGGIAFLATSAAWRPDLAILALHGEQGALA